MSLINGIHEQFPPLFFALFDFDDAVEIIFRLWPAFLDLALDQLDTGCIDVTIERVGVGGDLLDLEGGQKASPSFKE